VSYQGLNVDLTGLQKLNAERPCIPISEYANHINLPNTQKKKKNLNDQQYEIKVQRQKIEQILYAEVDVGLVSRGMKAKKIHLHKLMHFLCI